MGDFGIKFGSNLNTNTDLQVQYTTKFSTPKLYMWKNAQFTTNGSGVGSVQVAHDLGYIPIVDVWGKHTAQYTFLSSTSYSNAWSLIDSYNSYRPYDDEVTYYADEDYITISGTALSASTTYYFRVLVYVEMSDSFSGSSTIPLNDDFGFKNSKDGVNVFTGQEYQMKASSKYKALQYYPAYKQSSSLTLPAMWASYSDTQVEEAVYVDFNHNLGYAPVFQVFTDLGTANIYEAPYGESVPASGSYKGLTEVSAWCDSSRVRVLFRRESKSFDGNYGTVFAATTIAIKTVVYTENLAGSES